MFDLSGALASNLFLFFIFCFVLLFVLICDFCVISLNALSFFKLFLNMPLDDTSLSFFFLRF